MKRPVGTVEQECEAKDRLAIDDYIGSIIGLSAEQQEEVRQAVRELVKTRLEKAKSVKKGMKTKGGVNIDQLSNDILSRLEKDNLVEFFKRRISTVPLYTLNLPKLVEPVEIEKSLFGWRLNIGKNVIDCTSEANARYLSTFSKMGWDQAPVPKDDSYLFSIINQWEHLFEKAQAVLQEHASSILQNRTRNLLMHTVWTKLREQMS